MTTKTKRAALYVRVSTDHQTVENQISGLREVAGRRGWEVVEISTGTPASVAPRAATSVLGSTHCSTMPADGASMW
jgi:Resolvase, N terminal domain